MCVYPNAGLPNPMAETGFDETPADTSALLEEFAQAGLVNMAGGCCGTTPEHIRAIAGKVASLTPRAVPEVPVKTRLSGLEALNIDDETLFVNVGEAHQRDGQQDVRPPGPRGEIRRGAGRGASRSRTGPRSSTSTWTRRCWTRWPVCTASPT